MKLSTAEFRAMQSLPRRMGQRFFEFPVFRELGMDLKNKDVLEVGCGSGYGAFLLHKLNPKSYVGLDVMEEQIELAQMQYPQFRFLVQSAQDLSQFANESLDTVVIFGVLHHIKTWRMALDEIKRVLRPNGNLFLEEPRRSDIKLFDSFFRWAHPNIDFDLHEMELHLVSRGMVVERKQWTPLMTAYHIKKTRDS